MQPSTPKPNSLEGITLLRYAHIYRNRASGGVEQYLKRINHSLLAKNRMTILQMHLVDSDARAMPEVERRGLGRLVWLPVRYRQVERSLFSLGARLKWLWAQEQSSEGEGKAAKSSRWQSFLRAVLSNRCGHLRYETIIRSEALAGALDEYRVDLVIGHWFSYDLGSLISEAARRRIPFAAVHHFDNRRLGWASTRRWLRHAVTLGGVSSRGVPAAVQGAFVNLSDAVDTEFFSPQASRPISRPKGQVILLPARIIAGKGHDDLLFCARSLAEAGADFSVVFAGAVDSPTFRDKLEAEIGSRGLRERVVFAGELSPEQIRDWYAASDLVVLPSYAEGLGRVLLEAQAMERPVIAYDSGGVPEAVIPGETGWLVKPGDRKALTERIHYLCDHPAERQRMGSCGRRFVMSRFSMPALIERHERFCLTSLQSPGLARETHSFPRPGGNS